jgi:hypothetical protein
METCNIGAYNRTRTYTALLKKFEDQGLERFIAYARKGTRGRYATPSTIRFANAQGFLVALSLCEAPGAVRFRVLQARMTAAVIALPFIIQARAHAEQLRTKTEQLQIKTGEVDHLTREKDLRLWRVMGDMDIWKHRVRNRFFGKVCKACKPFCYTHGRATLYVHEQYLTQCQQAIRATMTRAIRETVPANQMLMTDFM